MDENSFFGLSSAPEISILDEPIAPGLRLWMLLALVLGILTFMIIVVCCFMKIRIPRTKRQIEVAEARRNARKKKQQEAKRKKLEEIAAAGGTTNTVLTNLFSTKFAAKLAGAETDKQQDEEILASDAEEETASLQNVDETKMEENEEVTLEYSEESSETTGTSMTASTTSDAKSPKKEVRGVLVGRQQQHFKQHQRQQQYNNNSGANTTTFDDAETPEESGGTSDMTTSTESSNTTTDVDSTQGTPSPPEPGKKVALVLPAGTERSKRYDMLDKSTACDSLMNYK